MDKYLEYVGGTTGAIALGGIAAASAYYLATRPKSEDPLFPLDEQTILENEVSIFFNFLGLLQKGFKYF